ncbi:hypothetical protein [Fimbriiglobus ruber]|uniref:Lipoprotein n=1 Tax=Fimbriiglobus ruber TaxID=1908690 RepID=A0A225DWH9_9BACT|nr:hypothetical protein [Fimbriiglobus ruber]OWK45742.1 hypothetical protein FRUB_02073 [Fimbriiglobus ruber]
MLRRSLLSLPALALLVGTAVAQTCGPYGCSIPQQIAPPPAAIGQPVTPSVAAVPYVPTAPFQYTPTVPLPQPMPGPLFPRLRERFDARPRLFGGWCR